MVETSLNLIHGLVYFMADLSHFLGLLLHYLNLFEKLVMVLTFQATQDCIIWDLLGLWNHVRNLLIAVLVIFIILILDGF